MCNSVKYKLQCLFSFVPWSSLAWGRPREGSKAAIISVFVISLRRVIIPVPSYLRGSVYKWKTWYVWKNRKTKLECVKVSYLFMLLRLKERECVCVKERQKKTIHMVVFVAVNCVREVNFVLPVSLYTGRHGASRGEVCTTAEGSCEVNQGRMRSEVIAVESE